jgi:hypothetical protein
MSFQKEILCPTNNGGHDSPIEIPSIENSDPNQQSLVVEKDMQRQDELYKDGWSHYDQIVEDQIV